MGESLALTLIFLFHKRSCLKNFCGPYFYMVLWVAKTYNLLRGKNYAQVALEVWIDKNWKNTVLNTWFATSLNDLKNARVTGAEEAELPALQCARSAPWFLNESVLQNIGKAYKNMDFWPLGAEFLMWCAEVTWNSIKFKVILQLLSGPFWDLVYPHIRKLKLLSTWHWKLYVMLSS